MGAFSAKKTDLKSQDLADQPIGLLTLTGDCSIQYAIELKIVILECLDQHQIVHLDLDMAESFDLASVQLLYSAIKYADSIGRTLQLTGNPSAAFFKTVQDAGMDQLNWLSFQK